MQLFSKYQCDKENGNNSWYRRLKKRKKNKKRKRNRLHSNICTWRLQHDYSRILSPWTLPSEVVFHSANLLIVADLLIFYDHIVAIDPLRFPLFRLHSTKNLQKTLKDLSSKLIPFPANGQDPGKQWHNCKFPTRFLYTRLTWCLCYFVFSKHHRFF